MAVARLERHIEKYPQLTQHEHMAFFLNDVADRNKKFPEPSIRKDSPLLTCALYDCRPENRLAVLHILLDAGYFVAQNYMNSFIMSIWRVHDPQVHRLLDAYWSRLVAHGLDINRNVAKLNMLFLYHNQPLWVKWLLQHGADPSKMPNHIDFYEYVRQDSAKYKGQRPKLIEVLNLLNDHAKKEAFRRGALTWRSRLTGQRLSTETIGHITNFVT